MEQRSAVLLTDMIMGFRTTQLIHVAAKLGIADLLNDGPRHSEALAQATGADPQALYRVLRALTSLGIFAELNDGRFDLTPLAQLLQQDAPGSLRGLAVLYGEPWLWQAYGALSHTVQTGTTAFEFVHGANIFTYLAQHPDAAQIFQQAMTAFSGQELAAILAAYEFTNIRHAVDVGGGEGTLLAALLERYPLMQGTLFDLPPTIERVSKQRAGQTGPWARCTLVAGDFFQALPAGGDLYMLKRVIHDWPDAQSIAILKQCRIAIADTGKLLILERVIASGNDPSEAKLFDINMLVSAGGQERSREEFGALLEAAGFRLTQVIATASPLSIIEGTPV
jgi:hypothetical protein